MVVWKKWILQWGQKESLTDKPSEASDGRWTSNGWKARKWYDRQEVSNYFVICFNLNQTLICCHNRLTVSAQTNVMNSGCFKAKG